MEVRELSQNLLNRPKYRATLQKQLDTGTCHPSVECMLWHYAYGKPKDTLAIEGVEVLRVVIDK